MIAVIADDLSGAAELAGAAQARGMTAEVQTDFNPSTNAEVVAVDTDTRSGTADEAAQRVGEITRRVLEARPDWIYKKTDSVLRGHVRREITAMLSATGRPRALFVPANPSRGRIIRGGRYLADGTPLDQTFFARDPAYPATSSSVLELLAREDGENLELIADWREIPPGGIIVPDATTSADLAGLADLADESTLCAGAVEFFDALLVTRTGRINLVPGDAAPSRGGTTLFICGSAVAWPARREQCERRGIPVLAMPRGLMMGVGSDNRSDLTAWAAETAQRLADSGCVLIAIGDAPVAGPFAPCRLEETLAQTVEAVLQIASVERVFLEGGATAAAVLRRMKATRLAVRGQFAPGLPAFRLVGNKGPLLAIKPGSYHWPESIWPERS